MASTGPRCALSCLALIAFAGCFDDAGTAQVLTDPLWLAPLPASLTISWERPSYDGTCSTFGNCAMPVTFRIVGASCDNCDVDLPPLPSGTFTESTTLTGHTRGAGPITFTADLESDDGDEQTVQVSPAGDLATSLVPSCQQTFAINKSVGPCRPSRASGDQIAIDLSVGTMQHGVLPIDPLLPNDPNAATLAALLPTMSPDAAQWEAGESPIDPGTLATQETLMWTFGDTTLTSTIALPVLR